jgi:hypothetical protein
LTPSIREDKVQKTSPTEKFTAQRCKLDECYDTLGEDLYQLNLQQLTDEYLQASAM